MRGCDRLQQARGMIPVMPFGLSPKDDPSISTSRLLLRPLSFSDVPALFDAIESSRAHLERWLPWASAVKGHGDLRIFVDRCQRQNSDGAAHRGIFEPDGRLAGHMSIEDLVAANRAAEFGYWIRADRAGRGYATEAAQAILPWGFRNLDLHRVSAYVDVENAPSAHVLEKCGFAREGIVRHRVHDGVSWRDHFIFGLIDGAAPS